LNQKLKKEFEVHEDVEDLKQRASIRKLKKTALNQKLKKKRMKHLRSMFARIITNHPKLKKNEDCY